MFLVESTLLPVATLLPRAASAQSLVSSLSQISTAGQISQKLHYVPSSGSFYGIGSDNAIWKWDNSAKQWSRVTDGSIKDDFHFISESNIYAIGLDNQIWRWNGIRWSQESEGGKIQQKIWYVDGNHIYGIGTDNQVWRWGSAGGWVKITSNGQIKDDFHLIGESDIYGIGLDNQLWHYQNGTWSVTASGGKIKDRFRFVSSSEMYGIGMDDALYRWNGIKWAYATVNANGQLAGYLKDDFYIVSQNEIYLIGLDNQVWKWSASLTNSATPSTLDLKVNDSDGPISLVSGATASVSWNSLGFQTGDSCDASGAPAGSSFNNASALTSGSVGVLFANSGTYTLRITCYRGLRTTEGSLIPSASDSVIMNVGSTYQPPVVVSSGGKIAQRLHVVSPTLMYGIGLDNKIWKWSDIAGWSQIAGSGQVKDDFTLVNNQENNIYGIGLDNAIWHWNGVSWGRVTMMSGQISQRLHVVSPTLMYGIGLDNKIWKWSDIAGWSQIAGSGQVKDDFRFISESDIYGIGLDNQIWHWNGTNWQRIGVSISQIVPPVGVTPTSSRPTPTPTTTPMATLTLQRDQERILPDQLVSFSGTLDSSRVAFPQGISFFIAIPEKTVFERIEIDGRALGAGEFTLSGDTAKIPFSQNLYNGSHQFRIVLRNAISLVSQLDRRVAVWATVVDANNKLLLKGRTASTLVAHLPTEVIGRGVSLSVPRTISGWSSSGNCCWSSVGFQPLESGGSAVPGSTFNINNKKMYFPIREFGFGEIDVTRGTFFTPNSVPLLPENIAFTLFPSDALMQRVGMSLKQFSDPLSREFITAQYQYILGRDPSSIEISQYLPKFMQWRNPLANLMEVYNRRADVRQAIMIPRDRNIGGKNDGSPRPSWDKLLEWAATYGWKEEPMLASFKPQTGFDNGWQLFQELWTKYAPLVSLDSLYGEQWPDRFEADARNNPVAAIAYLCYTSNMNHKGSQQDRKTSIDFEFCWKNDPLVRHAAILWAKDAGWAYNQIFKETFADDEHGRYFMGYSTVTINPSGPILASVFGPGKYPEYAAETAMRYPPAQMYYDLISSTEYASSMQQRFRVNIDSIYRLFFGRPATESDIAWVKNKFIGGIASYEFPDSKTFGFDHRWSWINDQWDPNGGLIASNFQYVADEEFLKNPRFITDDVYGIRHIPGEIDAVSSRLIEMIERRGTQELYQGDNFKRIVSGLYRLYLRRTPTDAEVEERRASKKNFGDIEFFLNQSREYGKDPASADAIKNLYRNYLGRDPSNSEIALWSGKTVSDIANKVGKSPEIKSFAQQHPENAYIFPIKKIKIVKCGFFCSVFGKIVGVALNLIPGVGTFLSVAYFGIATGVSGGANITGVKHFGSVMHITLNSISRGFNESGFNGETFVQWVSIARAMAGQAGGVFSMTNIFENADQTILDGFRTMARVPQAPESDQFAGIKYPAPHYGLASLIGAASEHFGAQQPELVTISSPRLAQIDVANHYGGNVVGGVSVQPKDSKTRQTQVVKNGITKNLSRGSAGEEVLLLQKILGETDLTFLPEYRTGYYGPKTEAAVKRFQKRYGLQQTGTIGPKTRALLNSFR